MPEIAILGVGGVGGFIAGALEHAGTRVTVVAREETAATLAANGLVVESVRLGDFRAHPDVATRLRVDGMTLVVATKATGLAAALDRIEGQPALVVPLLNGLDHLTVLRERFENVAAASIRIEADRPETGHIVHTSPFLRVDVAPRTPPVETFAATVRAADVAVDVYDSEPRVMWGKLVRLNAIALATSAWDEPIGPILADPERYAEIRAAVEEAAAVATADGAPMDPEDTMSEIDALHPTLKSSMQRDIAAGREPELDAIAGSVLRAASRHGVDCPAIERLASRVAERAGIMPPL
jgi:2-dehydropantoate 2-reductase